MNRDELEFKLEDRFGATTGAVLLFVIEVLQIVIISSAIIIPIRYFLVQPFYVKGASMEPSFHDHEYLIIDELSYRFRTPSRGEIVVFKYPRDPSQYFIKRVVAVPGETVEVTDGNVVVFNDQYPNGKILEETYIDDEHTGGKDRVTLAQGEYYVMGDNRNESLDSRSFGPIHERDMIGRVWVRGLPINKIGSFSLPDYNF